MLMIISCPPFLIVIIWDVIVADIPGLISGAHQNRGLGISFLKHIERCVYLLYVIDASLPEPWQQLHVLRYEIEQYNSELLSRYSAVVANKIDLAAAAANLAELRLHSADMNLPFFEISAKDNRGLVPVLQHIRLTYDSLIHDSTDDL